MSDKHRENGKVKATLILDKDARAYIQSTGSSLQNFFTELLEAHRHFDMQRWQQGLMFHHGHRVLVFYTDALNQLISQSRDPYETGKALGSQLRETIQAIDPKMFQQEFIINNLGLFGVLFGWGTVKYSAEKLIIEHPAITNTEFTRGYFEALLSTSLVPKVAGNHIQVFLTENAGN
ncbi:MAG: hypothetical protein HYU39_04865 [Thaumarchaeota archaeon]|nr:hypothetical protein [Nitrososphaerota archaeon]